MRRRVAAWPVGMIGNMLLFTVFLGGVFDTPQDQDLWGQAGRQVFFFVVSVYGWWRWQRRPRTDAGTAARSPRAGRPGGNGSACWSARPSASRWHLLSALGSWGPLADAWILTGSIWPPTAWPAAGWSSG